MDKTIKKIATAVRREMECFARKHSYIGCPNVLACYCAISSFFLVMVAKKLGYKLTLVEGIAFKDDIIQYQNGEEPLTADTNHCWVEYDGYVIDLTATQFDEMMKKVAIVNKTDPNYKLMFWPVKRHNAARRNLRRNWPSEQTPYSYLKELEARAEKVAAKLA